MLWDQTSAPVEMCRNNVPPQLSVVQVLMWVNEVITAAFAFSKTAHLFISADGQCSQAAQAAGRWHRSTPFKGITTWALCCPDFCQVLIYNGIYYKQNIPIGQSVNWILFML